MRELLLALALCATAAPAHAQLLKKLKDKVNKTVDKATGSGDQTSAADPSPTNTDDSKSSWCDSLLNKGDGAGPDGVSYSLAFSSPDKFGIVYQESSIGLTNNAKGFRLVLSQYVNGKTQFTVVENGKVVLTDTKVGAEYLKGASSNDFGAEKSEDSRNEEMQKYLVADSMKMDVPKTAAKSATIQKIDEGQLNTALEMAKQTDEYKNMSAEEKKDFEKIMQEGVKQNNAMAGQTISTPEVQGGNYAAVTGYKLIVKGKNYGKFVMQPVIEVSKDETSIFAVGLDDKSNPALVTNVKKTMLDKNKYSGIGGKILRSADGSRFVYIESKKMSEAELADIYAGKAKMSYNALRKDGSSILITDENASGKFTLTNSGSLINVNESTGDVYADGKKIGRFTLQPAYKVSSDAILMGADASRIAYYDGATGSINYLDGTTKKLGIMFPKIVTANGKSYLTWFRKCKNEIYLARFEY